VLDLVRTAGGSTSNTGPAGVAAGMGSRPDDLSIRCNDLNYTASICRFTDGTLAEIFISSSKAGSDSDAAAKDSAVVASIALQFGEQQRARELSESLKQQTATIEIYDEQASAMTAEMSLQSDRCQPKTSAAADNTARNGRKSRPFRVACH
jgi:hypothetical protein